MKDHGSLSQWLEERCQREHLSLRQAAARTGLSHGTVRDIMNGTQPLPETIKKLAAGFGGEGTNLRFALEDYLLTLAGYRSERPEEELNEPAYLRIMPLLSHEHRHIIEVTIELLVRELAKIEGIEIPKRQD